MYTIDYIMMAVGSMVAVVVFAGMAYAAFWAVFNAWAVVKQAKLNFESQNQNLAIQAASVKTQLMIADKQSNLVYANNGFMPVSHAQIMDNQNTNRLLDLAAKRIDTLKLPENVPHHLHVVTTSDTEQTLNQGAAGQPMITGDLGSIDFLLPSNKNTKYKLIEGGADE